MCNFILDVIKGFLENDFHLLIYIYTDKLPKKEPANLANIYLSEASVLSGH
jgi:hypothetical protein